MLTLTIALALWAFLRVLDEEERHPRAWAATLAACLGLGLLLKSLIGVVFPIGAIVIYLLITRQFFSSRMWKQLRPFSGLAIILLIAAPWHILATLRNPPYFSLTMKSVPGEYHGFLWFYFINEQLLRFLNLRYPRDYDTVPPLYFWLFNLAWLFPWSVYLPAAFRLSYRPVDRAGKTRLLALCWIGFVMVFFTFSTTQEYYSMPIYPAMALLIGSAMATEGKLVGRDTAADGDLQRRRGGGDCHPDRGSPRPDPGRYLPGADIQSRRLQAFAGPHGRPDLEVFCLPSAAAGAGRGCLSHWRRGHAAEGQQESLSDGCPCMVVFFHAARLAMVSFDPYLSSRPLVDALKRSPQGELIVDHHYYWFSSVFFYTDRTALLLNGRFNNMVYGSYAPGSANVFIDDSQFQELWRRPERYYIFAKDNQVDHLKSLVSQDQLNTRQ